MLSPHDPVRSTSTKFGAVAALGVALLVTACSTGGTAPAASSTASSPATGTASSAPGTSSSTGSSGPVGVEVHPPGDIPDNQAFVPYTGVGFVVSTPEGWARSTTGSAVTFSDKYNSITVTATASAQAPTIASARARDISAIKVTSKGFVPGAISMAHRKSGTAVLITYRAYSPVNPVTGKFALEAVERYTFWRAGQAVTLTLAAPVGSDNVDPWRRVTDSFKWTK